MGQGRTIVFFYGFPGDWTKETFESTICADFSVARVDFMDGKLMAFVHCQDTENAQALISKWNGESIDGKRPMQVRFRDSNSQGRNNTMNSGSTGTISNKPDKKSIFMRPVDIPFKPFNPKPVDEDYHDETGYSRQVMKFSGFDTDLDMNQAIDALSCFGPIHTFYSSGPGEFTVRFCYDLCNDFAEKHLVTLEKSPLVTGEKIPAGLTCERIDDLEEWL